MLYLAITELLATVQRAFLGKIQNKSGKPIAISCYRFGLDNDYNTRPNAYLSTATLKELKDNYLS